MKELRLEDTQGYSEMMRMNYDSFKFVLLKIEKDITRFELAKGGLKPISPAERLTLTLRFLVTGETYRSLSFQFRILRKAISYIKHLVNIYLTLSFPRTRTVGPKKCPFSPEVCRAGLYIWAFSDRPEGARREQMNRKFTGTKYKTLQIH